MRQHVRFLREYLTAPSTVGAVSPSSTALARALCEPYVRADHPVAVLEVGAGTGAVTRYLGRVLRTADQLDICEISPAFVRILERDVLSDPAFDRTRNEGRVRLIEGPLQGIEGDDRYDFIISGLPLTAFSLPDVQDVLATVRRLIKPGGVFSYFEYIGLRRLSRSLTLGKGRARKAEVSRCLSAQIRAHQFDRRTVVTNFPPAHARHLRFDAEQKKVSG